MIIREMKEIIDKLVECGLTDKEAKVYSTLSRLGPVKASILARELELPRSELYNLLKKLQDKGMVETTLERPMKFVAISFEIVIDQLIRDENMKIEELKAILNSMRKREI